MKIKIKNSIIDFKSVKYVQVHPWEPSLVFGFDNNYMQAIKFESNREVSLVIGSILKIVDPKKENFKAIGSEFIVSLKDLDYVEARVLTLVLVYNSKKLIVNFERGDRVDEIFNEIQDAIKPRIMDLEVKK